MVESLTDNLVSSALDYFRNGLYCSEAILKSFNENGVLSLPEEFLKVATAFGVGIGASKCCCGSLTGGVLVLSSILGRTRADQPDGDIMACAGKLHDEFKKEFGATCCRVLTRPVEWGSTEHHVYCERFVKRTVELTAEILREYKKIQEEN